MPERLRTLRHCIFTGGVLETDPLSLATLDSSPKGTPLRYAGNFAATAEAVPLGKVDCRAAARRKGCSRRWFSSNSSDDFFPHFFSKAVLTADFGQNSPGFGQSA